MMEQRCALGFREVIPDQTLPVKWKEIILDTGCTQSTLQDIKATERAGGYSFNDCEKNVTRNRFIYWRITQDILELVDLSLDLTLVDNHLRYKFTDTPLLDGLTIHETANHVIILVATVSSVHRLIYPHPTRLYIESQHCAVVASIFSEATLSAAKDPSSFHVITRPNNTANCPLPNACASWLCSATNDAVFSLACSAGTMLLVRMYSTGQVQLKHITQTTSMVPRLFANIAEALRGKQEVASTVAMVLHNLSSETFLFCLDSDAALRVWSANNPGKPMSVEVLVPDGGRVIPGFQPHMMRKCVSRSGQLCLVIYLCFAQEARFLVVTPVFRDATAGDFLFVRNTDVFATEYLHAQRDLVDMCASESCLWAMWRTADSATAVTSVSLTAREFPPAWRSAVLEEVPREPSGLLDANTEPKTAYVDELFKRGRFSMAVITRALSIYQRSSLLLDHVVHSSRVLQDMVCQAVEEDILKDTRDLDTDEEDYLELAHQHWAQLYSCCLQYYLTGDKPGGLAVLHNGGLLLVKKQRFSILRPMDVLERCASENSFTAACLAQLEPLRNTDVASRKNVERLLEMLRELSARIPEEQMRVFNTRQHDWRPHNVVATQLAAQLVRDETDENILDAGFLNSLYLEAGQMDDLYDSMGLLLSCLSPELPANELDDDLPLEARRPIGRLYASQLGCSVVTHTLRHIIKQRLSLCRCLLLLESLVQTRVRHSASTETRRAVVLPCAVLFAHAYYALDWVCNRPSARHGTVLEMFVQQVANNTQQALTNKQIEDVSSWEQSLLPYVTIVGGMLWPLSDHLILPDFLHRWNQLSALLGYEALLGQWCETNMYSRRFIVGCAMLRQHEAHKACQHLMEAAHGVTKEPYILEALQGDNITPDRAQAVYYLKVLEMLQQGGYYEEGIETTRAALAVIDPDEPELPMFHWLLFTHSIALGRYDEAYCAMVANPDEEKRKDCLQKFIFTLIGQKKISTLLQFPYMGLFSDVERVLESRARHADVSSAATDYEVLYSWHVRHGNMRKAALYMYERAYRMERELPATRSNMERQKGCYLVCLNCLRLVDNKYRWLVRPKQPPTDKQHNTTHDKVKVKLMQVDDLKREVEILNARIKLSREKGNDLATVSGRGWSAVELVGVLTSARLYCNALRLVTLFKLSAQRPLEGLTLACVQLQREPTSDAWDWLVNNDLSEVSDGEMNASNTAWKLLQVLLTKHEAPGMTVLHKAVLNCLLQEGFFPPVFLLSSYKERNPPELLSLLLHAGRLREAASMALDYLAAMLGSGSEYYGGCKQLLAGQPTCLPWQTLDQLVEELDRPKYQQEHEQLKSSLVYFINTASRLSLQPAVGLATR